MEKNKFYIIFLACLIVFANNLLGQANDSSTQAIVFDASYKGNILNKQIIATIHKETDTLLLIHILTFSKEAQKNENKMLNNDRNPFVDTNNNYARLVLINKKTKDTIFNIPSIIMTHLKIDTVNSMIIGVSSLSATYNIAIFSYSGKLLVKRITDVYEYKLNKKKLKEFERIDKKVFNELILKDAISYDKNFYYIPTTTPRINSHWDTTTKKYLLKYITGNHVCNLTVNTNHELSGCFNGNDMGMELIVKKGIPIRLILNGYKNKVFESGAEKDKVEFSLIGYEP